MGRRDHVYHRGWEQDHHCSIISVFPQGAPESIEFLIEDSSQPLRACISQGRGKNHHCISEISPSQGALDPCISQGLGKRHHCSIISVFPRARLSPSSSWSIVVAHPREHALSIEYGMLSSSLAERRTHCPGIVNNTKVVQ